MSKSIVTDRSCVTSTIVVIAAIVKRPSFKHKWRRTRDSLLNNSNHLNLSAATPRRGPNGFIDLYNKQNVSDIIYGVVSVNVISILNNINSSND